LLITIFGDSIAPHGGAVSLASLIRLTAPFGVSERLVRTSVGRLALDGRLTCRRVGRQSEYALAEDGSAVFAAAAERIYASSPPRWDGAWTMIVFPRWPASSRDALRHELRFAGFGEPLSGLFLHPFASLAQAAMLVRKLDPEGCATLLRTEPGVAATGAGLAANGWDLGGLDRRYREFIRRFEPLERVGGLNPPSAFQLRTLLIHEYRRIHLLDPDLPADLLPQGWAGATARTLCGKIYRQVFDAAESHVVATAECVGAALPPAKPDTRRRFGGLERSRQGP
jgi:phenylacetic acid degradation operon negative regulatory protein